MKPWLLYSVEISIQNNVFLLLISPPPHHTMFKTLLHLIKKPRKMNTGSILQVKYLQLAQDLV